MIWITIIALVGIYVGLAFLENEEGDWSVFFKGLRMLLVATLCVILMLALLYAGQSEAISVSVGLCFGLVLYFTDKFIEKKVKSNERKSS